MGSTRRRVLLGLEHRMPELVAGGGTADPWTLGGAWRGARQAHSDPWSLPPKLISMLRDGPCNLIGAEGSRVL